MTSKSEGWGDAMAEPQQPDTPLGGGKSGASGKLESLSKDDLIKFTKKQVLMQQKLKAKVQDLTNKLAQQKKDESSTASGDKQTEMHYKMMKSEYEVMKSERDELKAAYSQSQQAQERYLQEYQELESRLEAEKSDKDDLNEQLKKLTHDNKALTEQMDCMTMKTETLMSTFQCLQQEQENSTKENKELKDEVELLTNARDDMLESLKSVKHAAAPPSGQNDQQFDELRLENDTLKASVSETVVKIEELEKTVGALEQEKTELLAVKEKFEALTEQKREMLEYIKEIEGENDELALKFEKLKNEKENTDKDFAVFRQSSGNLKERLDSATGLMKDIQEQRDVTLKEKELEIAEKQMLTEKFMTVEDERDLLQKRLSDSKTEIDELNQRNDALELWVQNLTDEKEKSDVTDGAWQTEQLNQQTDELNKLNQQTDELKARLEEKTLENEKIRSDLSELEEKFGKNVADREEERAELKNAIESRENEMEILKCTVEERDENAESLKLRLEAETSEKKVVEAKFEEVSEQVENLKSEIVELNEKISELRSRNDELDEKLNETEATQNSLVAENSKLESRRTEFENSERDSESPENEKIVALEQEKSRLRDEIENMEAEMDKFIGQVNKLESDNVQLNETIARTEKACSELMRRCEHLEAEKLSSTSAERTAEIAEANAMLQTENVELRAKVVELERFVESLEALEKQKALREDVAAAESLKSFVGQTYSTSEQTEGDIVAAADGIEEVERGEREVTQRQRVLDRYAMLQRRVQETQNELEAVVWENKSLKELITQMRVELATNSTAGGRRRTTNVLVQTCVKQIQVLFHKVELCRARETFSQEIIEICSGLEELLPQLVEQDAIVESSEEKQKVLDPSAEVEGQSVEVQGQSADVLDPSAEIPPCQSSEVQGQSTEDASVEAPNSDEDLRNEIIRYKKLVEKHELKEKELWSQIDTIGQQKQRAETTLEQAEKRFDDWEQTFVLLNAENQRVTERVAEVEEQERALQAELDDTTRALHDALHERDHLRDAVCKLTDKDNSMIGRIETLNQTIADAMSEKDSLQFSVDEIKGQNEETERAIEELRVRLTEMTEMKRELEKLNEEGAVDVENLKRVESELRAENEKLSAEVGVLTERIAGLELERDVVKVERQTSIDEASALRELNERLKSEFVSNRSDLEGALESGQQNCETLRTKLQGLETEFENLTSKYQELEESSTSTIERLQSENSALLQRREELEIEVNQLKENMTSMCDTLSQSEKLQTDLLSWTTKYEEQQISNAKLQTELDRCQTEKDQIANDLEDSKTNGENLQSELSALTEKNAELQRKLGQFKKLLVEMKSQKESWMNEKAVMEERSEESAKVVENLQTENSKVVSDLQTEHEKVVANLQTKHDKVIADLQTEHEKVVADLQTKHDKVIADLQTEHEKVVADLQTKHDKVIADLQMEHEKVVADLQTELEAKCRALDDLQREFNELKERSKLVAEEFESFKLTANLTSEENANELETQLNSSRKELASLRDEFEKKTDEVTKLTATVEEMAAGSNDLKLENARLENEIKNVVAERDGLAEKFESASQNLEELKTRASNLESENSRFQTENTDLISRVGIREEEINEQRDLIARLQGEVAERQELRERAEDLTRELAEVKSKQAESLRQAADTDSESVARVQQLESALKDSEEKCGKLKMVAIKTKKELAEVKAKLEPCQQEADELRAEKEENLTMIDGLKSEIVTFRAQLSESEIAQQSKQNLESAIEELRRELETAVEEKTAAQSDFEKSAEKCRLLADELHAIVQQLADTKTRLADLQIEKENAVAAKSVEIKELENSLKSMTQERDAEKVQKDQFHSDKEKLEVKLKQFESQTEKDASLHAEIVDKLQTKIQETEERLSNADKERKQNSLMDLEMADYERTVQNMNESLADRDKYIDELKVDIGHLEEKVKSLVTQLESSDIQKAKEEDHGKKLKQLLIKTKKELAETKKQENELLKSNVELQALLEASAQIVEETKVQMSNLTAENQQLNEKIRNSKDTSSRSLKTLETKLQTSLEDLELTKSELTTLQAEYDGYKIRVHSVLKQQKTKNTDTTSDFDKQERERLEKVVEQLRAKLHETKEQLATSVGETEMFQDENERLQLRITKLIQDLQEKELAWKEKIDELSAKTSVSSVEHAEAIRQFSLQNESITRTFKEQMKTLQTEHHRETESLRKQMEITENELLRLQREHYHKQTTTPVVSQQQQQQQYQQLMVHAERSITPEYVQHVHVVQQEERQQGEGMEHPDADQLNSVPSTPTLVPFDQLLMSPSESYGPRSLAGSSIADDEAVRENLSKAEKKIEHLNELVNENEATILRLTEQAKILKEEIRRLERNQERETAVSNMEYLKNIILKFLSLKAGDERQQLIPVLTTMLKLSPDEKQQMIKIAHDGDETAVVEATAASGGWTSYLHRWSGLT